MRTFKNGRALKGIKDVILTLGNFDGLHLGHRKIIKKVVRRAGALGLRSALYTFEPHPLKVVAPDKSPPLIMDAKTKARVIKDLGIDDLILARFTKEFAGKHPEDFVREVIVDRLSAREVWVGHDFSFGRGRAGTVGYLSELGERYGFRVFVIPAHKKGGHIVSSSRVRMLLLGGRVEEAARLLGKSYSIKGRVVRGKNIGKAIGFPTANIRPTGELVPRNGVYAGYVSLKDKRLPCVINIGVAPTFGAKPRTIEVHIMDFRGNLYGKEIEVSFVRRLRSERAFRSKEALIERIGKDVERARKLLWSKRG